MSDDRRGLLWPLAFLFLLTACDPFIGYMAPVFGGTLNKEIPFWLLMVALATGVVLYIPRFWIAINVPTIDAMSANIDRIHTNLCGPQGNQDRLGEINTAITGLRNAINALSSRLTDLNARLQFLALCRICL